MNTSHGAEEHYHHRQQQQEDVSNNHCENIISFTHFPEAHERAQHIVEETEKARISMEEEYAHKTTTTAR